MTDETKVEYKKIKSPAEPDTESKTEKTSVAKSKSSSGSETTTKKPSTSSKTTAKKSATANKSATAGTSTKSTRSSSTAKPKTTAAKTAASSSGTKSTAAKSTAASKSATASKSSSAKSAASKSSATTTKKTAKSQSTTAKADTSVADEVKAATEVEPTVETPIAETETAATTEQVAEKPQETSAAVDEGVRPGPQDTAEAERDGAQAVTADGADEKTGEPADENDDGKDYILEVEGLQTYFPIAKTIFGKPKVFLRAVDNVGFKIERGTTLGVVGESGCGKTTLGRTVLKLYEPNGGKIIFDGDDLTHLKKSQMLKYRTKLQLIFQDPYSSLPPRMTVGSIIAEAVKIHKIVPKEQVYDYVQGIMKQCGLQPQYYDRYPHEFSGGQRQRICIARALAVKPELVICDEPVSALDVSIQAQIINLLKGLQQQMGLTYLFISHDLSVVKYITDRILVMYLGNMMELGDTDEIFSNPLHPYTQALFSAVPVPDPDVKMKRIILEGDIPSPANPPKGCKFHTRCSRCMDVCKFKAPKYVCVKTESGKDHFVACHLYDEEVMSDLPAYTEEYNKLEAERLAKEEAARIKKENSGWYKFKKKVSGLFKKKKKNADAEQSPEPDVSGSDTPSVSGATVEADAATDPNGSKES